MQDTGKELERGEGLDKEQIGCTENSCCRKTCQGNDTPGKHTDAAVEVGLLAQSKGCCGSLR